ncbi:Alpha/Beta hydrolase protein [Xylariales sp. PMI_506]|nr:Alpha/Beta hydrolase protein [Xylariales sp. PMI_506]
MPAPLQDSPAARLPNTYEQQIQTPRGDYVVRVSWPPNWNSAGKPKSPIESQDIGTLYVFDGNAYFATAVEAARRLQHLFKRQLIVVGVAYPDSDFVFDRRRGGDLTPPNKDGKYEDFVALDGTVIHPKEVLGGAEDFISTVEKQVIPLVETELFSHLQLSQGRRAIFGHSFGGLFTLFTMFTRPALFDTYVSASPSIFFNDCSVIRYQEKDFLASKAEAASDGTDRKPLVYLSYGSLEQHVPQNRGEPDDHYAKRSAQELERKMADHAAELRDRLEASGRFREVAFTEFEGEDHMGAAICGLQRGIVWFLKDE